jgi:adenosylhomocysteine nucleosidase
MSFDPIGLIVAIPEELEHFGAALRQDGREERAGLLFLKGTLDGVPLVAVEAGLGKVNAGVVATLLLDRFGCRALVFSGVAGGLDPALCVGDVVIGTRLVAHDYGAMVGGELRVYQPGARPLPEVPRDHGYHKPPALEAALRQALEGLDLPLLSAAATGDTPRLPRIVFGTILTGDLFINCVATRERLHSLHHGQAVEMEGAAIAQVAERFGRPWVIVRALSDLAGDDSHISFGAFVLESAAVAALIVRRIVAAI